MGYQTHKLICVKVSSLFKAIASLIKLNCPVRDDPGTVSHQIQLMPLAAVTEYANHVRRFWQLIIFDTKVVNIPKNLSRYFLITIFFFVRKNYIKSSILLFGTLK